MPRSTEKNPPRAMSFAVRGTDDKVAATLITAAVATMAAKGYHGTSVRDIASEAGVAVGSLYNYFGSKQELLALILNRGLDASWRRPRKRCSPRAVIPWTGCAQSSACM